MKKFPEGFYWGAATASYQVEGNIHNTDWAKAAEEGRVPIAGRLCDHYNLYEQDFDIAKQLGHNAHRFSVEWARIEPEEGYFDVGAIEHYRNVLRALHERGLKPYLTLWHFTLPIWFAEKGGFEKRGSAQIFARYAEYVTKELGPLVEGISTMNEPVVYASNGWLRGTWPPFKRFKITDAISIVESGNEHDSKAQKGFGAFFVYLRVFKNLARAHNAAYKKIKAVNPSMEVSLVKHVILFHSSNKILFRIMAWFSNYHWTHTFMRRVHKRCDAIGLNYYIHKKFGDTRQYEKTDMNWDMYPEGIYQALKILAVYKKPLFVSEAGIADEHDANRADYIRKQVAAVWEAIQDGVDVRGHMYWSLLDNYEWALGTRKRFGLIEVDYDTLERKIRPSAFIYKDICEKNAVQ